MQKSWLWTTYGSIEGARYSLPETSALHTLTFTRIYRHIPRSVTRYQVKRVASPLSVHLLVQLKAMRKKTGEIDTRL